MYLLFCVHTITIDQQASQRVRSPTNKMGVSSRSTRYTCINARILWGREQHNREQHKLHTRRNQRSLYIAAVDGPVFTYAYFGLIYTIMSVMATAIAHMRELGLSAGRHTMRVSKPFKSCKNTSLPCACRMHQSKSLFRRYTHIYTYIYIYIYI